MSDWLGSLSSGEVRIPATFKGTARLLDGTEMPRSPRPARHDDLPGRFEADLDISFALLIGAGYQSVDPSHPAYPLYLAARAEHERGPQAAPAPAMNPHDPDMVVMPFETTVTVTEAMALRHGLMAPGRAGSAGDEADPVRPVRRKPAPPIWHRGARIGAGRDTARLPSIDDFGAFLAVLGDPERHPMPIAGAARPPVPQSGVDAQAVGQPSAAGPGADSIDDRRPTVAATSFETTRHEPVGPDLTDTGPAAPTPTPPVPVPGNGSANAPTRAVSGAPIRGACGTGRFGRDRMSHADLNVLGLGDTLRAMSAPSFKRAPVAEAEPAIPEDFAALPGATPSASIGHRVLDLVMRPDAPLPPAIRAITGAPGGSEAGRASVASAGSSGTVTTGEVAALLRGMREAELSPPSGRVQLAQAGASDVPTAPRMEGKSAAASPREDTKPVLLVDDHGNPVMSQGRTVERPASLDPEMFVKQGLADKVEYDALGTTDGGAAAQLVYLVGKLSKFGQGHEWDAQRVSGTFNPAYVDYATIAIGLYCAALGLSQSEILHIEDGYAKYFSRYKQGTKMDGAYKHLPARNVVNTQIDYDLYKDYIRGN